MVLTDALKGSRERTHTPLQADAWRKEIARFNLTSKYPTLANSILFGFKAGVPRISHTFSPPNKLDTPESREAFNAVMANELATGRWLGPFSQEDVESVLGPFQTSPIAMIDKPGKPGKFRLVQNLSYPYKPTYIPTIGTTISSINSHIDSSLYPCFWGTFANTCRLIWTLPPGSQGAVRDISEAYRSIPLHPSQWPGIVVRTSEQDFCVDIRDMFGLASSGGVFGHVADAGMEICRGHGLGPLTKWVDDYFWLRILREHLERYNQLQANLRDRIKRNGGMKYQKARTLFQGHTLPNGIPEEFDNDFVFPIQDLSKQSERSVEDARYTYAFSDIDKVTNPLGYVWAKEKDIPFGANPKYFGFQWEIEAKVVSVPQAKREKYLGTIREWEGRTTHDAKEVAKIYGQLSHVSLVLTKGKAYLTELEKFGADLDQSTPLIKHRPPKRWQADLEWWKRTLSSPISSPIPGPANLIDINAYSDASSSYGIGLCIGGFWRSYRLLPGWRGEKNERDIGWAEAAGFYLLTLIIATRAERHAHHKVWGDNEGVVEGWWNGRSRNRPTNDIFRRIHEVTTENEFYVHTRYIPSAHNPADKFSRGILGPAHLSLPRIPIPSILAPFIVDADTPPSAAEVREHGTPRLTPYPTETKQRTHRLSFEQWQREEEGRLLNVFRNAW